MSGTFRAALVQFTAARDVAPNLKTVEAMIREAHAGGADFILTPENTNFLEPVEAAARETVVSEEDDAMLAQVRGLASELGVWVLLGSISVLGTGKKRANRSVLINDAGEVAARYDKVHLFDVDIGDGQTYCESAVIEAGKNAVVTETPWGKIGLSVCYDLRFPHLYRALSQGGATMLMVPAAFTKTTGQAHWHTLLRARAIENGCFVFAPAQCGTHAEGRETFGHSLVVDPWGAVVVDGGDAPGVIFADIDMGRVVEARRMIPSLEHDPPFDQP